MCQLFVFKYEYRERFKVEGKEINIYKLEKEQWDQIWQDDESGMNVESVHNSKTLRMMPDAYEVLYTYLLNKLSNSRTMSRLKRE